MTVPFFASAKVPDISGRWRSEKIEKYDHLYATRSFAFSKSSWELTYQAYLDADTQIPVFTLYVSGEYLLGGQSKVVDAAHEGVFWAKKRDLIANSDAGVQLFASMGCALQIGTRNSLIEEGCGVIPSVMNAMGEYDLVSLKDGKLYFGDRSGDLTKSRPDKLTPFPLAKY